MTTSKIWTDKYTFWLRKLPLAIPFLFACNQTPKKDIPGVPYNPEDYSQTSTYTVAQPAIDTTNPFLIAKGKGDDWFCYFYAYKIRFLYNNCKDSIVTRANFEWDIRNNVVLNTMTIGTKTDKFNIEIDPDYNSEEVGRDSSRVKKIIINLDKRSFKGYVTAPSKK